MCFMYSILIIQSELGLRNRSWPIFLVDVYASSHCRMAEYHDDILKSFLYHIANKSSGTRITDITRIDAYRYCGVEVHTMNSCF